MAYITPRVKIQQEFLQLPVYREYPLPAFIIGPNYALTRYSVDAERPFTALGTYNGGALATGNAYISDADTTYDFPNVPAGGNVDHSYTKVYAEAVEAQYFPNAELNSNLPTQNDVALVPTESGENSTNQVRFKNAILKTGNGESRSNFFSNRDVTVGDIIEVSTSGANPVSVKAKVKAILPENSLISNDYASVVDDATADSSNPAPTNEYYAATPVPSGASGSTVIVTNESTAYKGHSSLGIFSDTYTVTSTRAGHDPEDWEFSISSASSAFTTKTGVKFTLPSTGTVYTLVIDDEDGCEVKLEFDTDSAALVVGTIWTIPNFRAPISAALPDTDGDYTGSVSQTYTITVTRGGLFYDPAQNNADTCAKLLIKASDIDTSSIILPKKNEYFNLGSLGAKARFTAGVSGDYLIAGNTYYVPVVAESFGPYSIVELSESLPTAMFDPLVELNASLSLTQKSIQIPAIKDISTDARNWTQEDAHITINSDITTYNNSLLASSSEPARLPVLAAKLFVEHRDLLQGTSSAIDSVRDLASITEKLGTVHPDNPLAQGVYDAVLNAQNMQVYFIGVQTDDLAGYAEAIQISEKSDKVYSFVPLTFDRTIQDAVVAHVNAYSTPDVGRWRIAWLSVPDQKTKLMYDLDENGDSYYATITDNTAVSGTQINLVTVEGAKFIDDGIRPNDTIRINFRLNADGEHVYDEYVVDRVRTNTQLLITTKLSREIPAAAKTKIQVVRNYTRSERAANIAAIGGNYNNRRVRVVFPDTYKYGNAALGEVSVTKQGYIAAAGLAGLRSGVVPHQGLTNSEFLGATDLSKVVLEFSQSELDLMAEKGIWLITQEVVGATPYVRHQLTTDERSLNTSEDSITTNVDSISYALKDVLAPFIGRYNVNPENILEIRYAIAAQLRFRANDTYVARAGNQLVSFVEKDDIVRIEQNATYKDRVDVEVRLHVPYPLNYINLRLLVG
jgi:hypothetical protein